MKRSFPIALAMVMISFSLAAQTAIRFDTPLLSEGLSRAEQQQRLIFVDCYTDWCAPCKIMEAEVFTDPAVAAYANARFVKVKLNMEDPEGREAQEKYQVAVYPTYMVLNAQGELIYKFTGSMPAASFLSELKKGTNPHNEARTAQLQYEGGQRHPELYRKMITLKLAQGEYDYARAVAAAYFQSMSDEERIRKENWLLYQNDQITDVHSAAFAFLITHYRDFCKVQGNSAVRRKTERILKGWALDCLKENRAALSADTASGIPEFYEALKPIDVAAPRRVPLAVYADIAHGALRSQVPQVGRIISSYAASLLKEKADDLIFAYITFCNRKDRTHQHYPYIHEIHKAVKKYASDDRLRLVVKNTAARHRGE